MAGAEIEMKMRNLQPKELHKDTSGAAMIVVVCVLMVVMIICLTMIVGAYQTLATVRDGRRDMLSYQQAYSLSEAIKQQLVTTGEKSVPGSTAGGSVTDVIAVFAADDSAFGTESAPVEEPSKVLTQVSASADPSGGQLQDIELGLRKLRAGTDRCRLFVTVSIKEDQGYVANCVAGYEVTLSGDGTNRKYQCVFKGYY